MKKRLLFCSLASLLTACQHESDVQPNPSVLAGEVVGTYHTNVYLDPSCVAISANQLPYVELKAESDSSVIMIYTKLYPAKTTRSVDHVVLRRQPDGIQLRLADSAVGTLQTDRIFMNTGMEKQGQLLRVSVENDPQNVLYFAGFKQ